MTFALSARSDFSALTAGALRLILVPTDTLVAMACACSLSSTLTMQSATVIPSAPSYEHLASTPMAGCEADSS